jgi:hypothetical protein
MAKTNTQTVLLTSQSLAAAAASVRAALDCSGKDGGQITFRITNGATAPTAQAVATLMVAHSNTTPATGAEGTGDTAWKQIYQLGGTNINNQSTRGVFTWGPEITQLQIEFASGTGQAVTIEAIATTYAYP